MHRTDTTRIRVSLVNYIVVQVNKAVSVPYIYRYISWGVRKSFSVSLNEKVQNKKVQKTGDEVT